jgi:oligopeptidase A
MQHPFLSTEFTIPWSQLTAISIEPDIKRAIESAESQLEAICALKDKSSDLLSYQNTIAALDEALEPLGHAWGLVNHLDSVCNEPALRSVYNKLLPTVSEFQASIPLNADLWTVIKAFSETAAASALSPCKQRYLAETIADFRDQGADLAPDEKARAKELLRQLAQATQKYSENCLDACNAWDLIIRDESRLRGLPPSALAAARESAKQHAKSSNEEPAWRFTLQAPSLIAVLTYAQDADLRKTVWQAYAAVGRQAPHSNQDLVVDILKLRHELAQLLGQAHWADHVTQRRMASTGATALAFGTDLHLKIKSVFQSETQALQAYKASQTDGTADQLLEPWDVGYWSEQQRQAQYAFDEEALRPYFAINRVIPGLFHLAETLFGLNIRERTTWHPAKTEQKNADQIEVWHPDVQYYEVFDTNSQEMMGAFYADWHPRESKRGGAWMNYLITGNRDPESTRSPHLGLICGNLTAAVDDKPALLTHREVETIFHEFGHLLHHICGEVEVKALNGVNVAWDFVELPSQIMENWCWERTSLDLFAHHYETGEPIPEALFKKMLAARNYRKASASMRQLSFGKMDLLLHSDWPQAKDRSLDDYIKAQLQGYHPEYKTEAPSNVFNFSHLFSGSVAYSAGYYSYKWAEVLDADAFTRFQKEGILNSETGRAFRDCILSQGNAKPAIELFESFMQRAPEPEALMRRDGLL